MADTPSQRSYFKRFSTCAFTYKNSFNISTIKFKFKFHCKIHYTKLKNNYIILPLLALSWILRLNWRFYNVSQDSLPDPMIPLKYFLPWIHILQLYMLNCTFQKCIHCATKFKIWFQIQCTKVINITPSLTLTPSLSLTRTHPHHASESLSD
jgi:hypothetical protein